MSAATRSRTPDQLCADAVELAEGAAADTAWPEAVGDHLGMVAESDRVVTHFFESRNPAYRGWRWAVTVARAARARYVTVDEVTLAPGSDALLAPAWLPWHDRLRPGDLGAGDLLPAAADDPRLAPGWSGDEVPPPNSALPGAAAWSGARPSGTPAGRDAVGPAGVAPDDRPGAETTPGPATAPAQDGTSAGGAASAGNDTSGESAAAVRAATGEPTTGTADETAPGATDETAPGVAAGDAPGPETGRGAIAAVAHELGMGRARVLSRLGLREAAERWEERFGPGTRMAESAPGNCFSCGFLVPMTGSLSQEFGVCGNELAPADGSVVSLTFGCGAHSEAAQVPAPPVPPPPVIDHFGADPL